MTREQAEEVERHLVDAAEAINRADAIILNLDPEDRKRLLAPWEPPFVPCTSNF